MRGHNLRKTIDAITLLSQPTGTTISALCDRLDIGQRQAYRLIETLQVDLKFIIDKDTSMPGGAVRYFLAKEYVRRLSEIKVADLNLSMAEIVALYLLKGHGKLYRGTEIEANIERAFAKLDVFVPEGFARKLERVKTLIISADKFSKDYEEKEEIIEGLTEAMLQQKTCRVEYHSFNDDKIKNFKIDPLKFFDWKGGLYLFVRTTAYGHIRMLAVERIEKLETGKDIFDYPDNFKPEELLDEAFGVVYDDPITVKIRFSADQERYIRERTWAKGQKIKEQKDGSIILTMKTSGWWDVRQWILSFGPDAELLEPVEKREEMKDLAEEVLIIYTN
ncbi:MAG: WYL domain-containing protein [Syntrophus sp. (in: bacteria)]